MLTVVVSRQKKMSSHVGLAMALLIFLLIALTLPGDSPEYKELSWMLPGNPLQVLPIATLISRPREASRCPNTKQCIGGFLVL